MTDDRAPYTVTEAAALLRVSEWVVGAMCRDGRLVRVPGLRQIRVVRASLDALLEGYDARRGESDRASSKKAPAPRRRQRRAPQGSLAGAPVGGGDPVPGRVGPAEGDVVVRRVEVRS